nr:transposase, mutator type [Tanacetum cinerariifolium]
MVKLSVDLTEPKDSSKTDKAAQNVIIVDRTPKSLTLEIHHGEWFTPTPNMVVKLGYGVKDLMYCHFLIPSLGLDYDLRSLNIDADVLEMSKYVKDYKIILVYVEHEISIFITPKKGVSIVVNNHLRKGPIEIDSSPDVNKTLTPMCHRNLTKEWEQVSSKSISIGEYAHIGKQITRNEITRNEITGNESTGKRMVVHVGNSSTFDDVLELGMLFKTEGLGPIRKFKEVEVDVDNESKEESDTQGDYTNGSDSEDLDYDPKHDDV